MAGRQPLRVVAPAKRQGGKREHHNTSVFVVTVNSNQTDVKYGPLLVDAYSAFYDNLEKQFAFNGKQSCFLLCRKHGQELTDALKTISFVDGTVKVDEPGKNHTQHIHARLEIHHKSMFWLNRGLMEKFFSQWCQTPCHIDIQVDTASNKLNHTKQNIENYIDK